jgi:mono/diheme cytochrome c family protein
MGKCAGFFSVSLWLVVVAALRLLPMDLAGSSVVQGPSPTPTYDPLVETPLPPHPTEFELGRNLYWHWCMTCHGDRGQGLTDDWRAVWVKDHQNCWARGCHAGRNGDQGFPIPTVVPLIIGDGHLAQFATLQDLTTFLKLTHPPQHPGILKNEEYHAIAVYVFTLNDRSLAIAPPTATPTPTLLRLPILTPIAVLIHPQSIAVPLSWLFSILAMVVLVVFLWRRLKIRRSPK